MKPTRRGWLALAAVSGAWSAQGPDFPGNQVPQRIPPPDAGRDRRLPNVKSQNDAIARKQHEDSLKDAEEMVGLAQQIRDELQKAGNYVVPLATVKKTEEIEKLARKIRGRLKS
jgi:hypothetical protein